METVRRWWRQPDRYEWLSSYLESRRLRWPLQVIMATTVTVLGFVPIILLWSPAVPSGWPARTIAVLATAQCWSMTFIWLTRWPSRRTSRGFALLSAVSVSAACLIAFAPQDGLTACVIFAAIAGLVAFTHTSPFLTVILGIAVGTSVICGVRAALIGDPALAISELLLVLASIVTVPMMGQVLVQLLGADAVNSHLDALTGLHNRRGFYRAIGDRTIQPTHGRSIQLGLVMIDLDEFKRVNDTHGHAAGDRALATVATVLRRVSGGNAVVARIGGEEFCIAATVSDEHLRHLADRVCTAVHGLPNSVTASVGTVATEVPTDAVTPEALDQLLIVADQAMYAAKRAGGNRVCHAADLPVSAGSDD